jgi:glycosyltransferase involved in cell wall biosynthesis
LIEAMALGVPVVAGDCAAVPGVVGDAGLVLPLRTASWAGALDEVRARRDDLVARGRRRAAQFTSRASGEDLVVAYESAMGLQS